MQQLRAEPSSVQSNIPIGAPLSSVGKGSSQRPPPHQEAAPLVPHPASRPPSSCFTDRSCFPGSSNSIDNQKFMLSNIWQLTGNSGINRQLQGFQHHFPWLSLSETPTWRSFSETQYCLWAFSRAMTVIWQRLVLFKVVTFVAALYLVPFSSMEFLGPYGLMFSP